MTGESPQTLEDSAAGEAGCSPHLQALPGSPPSRARGRARHSQVGDARQNSGSNVKWGSRGEKVQGSLEEGEVKLYMTSIVKLFELLLCARTVRQLYISREY